MTKGFFDEHLFAWFKHMHRMGYVVKGTRGYPGQPMNARTFGRTLFDENEIVLKYDV